MTAWLKKISLLAIVVICLLQCDIVSGRAGGGGGFSGGGGGGFSGGGGFGGGGFSGGGFSSSRGSGSGRPATKADFIIAFIVLAIIIAVVVLNEKAKAHQTTSVAEAGQYERIRLNQRDQAIALATLRAADPDFDLASFLTRFRAAFLQIQNAWQRQDIDPIRHFVSDSIFERFTLQIAEQQDMGYRDQMEDIAIHGAVLAEAVGSQVFDVMTVQVTAAAIDFRVSLETGQYVSGNRTAEMFTEFWSFIRRRGAQTETDKLGLIEGYCPNCGDSIELNQIEKCGSCDALLRSGEHDWVLAEITQASVWKPRSADEFNMARQYRETHDPGFNVQHLEDRASVIFWRKAMADRLGDTKPLMKMATDSFCAGHDAEYKSTPPDQQRRYFGSCSVGSVDLKGLVTSSDNHYALVEIHWSSHVHAADPDGTVHDHGNWRRRRTLFVLRRRQGVQSDIKRAIDSSHCPTCGAPESDLASHACEFCETVLNDGSHDWVLAELHDQHSAAAIDWLNKARSTQPRASSNQGPTFEDQYRSIAMSHSDALAWTVSVLAADKNIDARERKAIQQIARKQHMSDSMVDGLIESALAGELQTPAPPTHATGRMWMEQMADAALLDGTVQPEERTTLVGLGRKAGLTGIDVNLLINKRRAELHRQTRQRPDTPVAKSTQPPNTTLLLEALFCVMASDLKVSKSERTTIANILTKLGVPLDSEQLDNAMREFVPRVKEYGFDSVVDQLVNNLRARDDTGLHHDTLSRAFAMVAKADGAVTSQETKAIRRLEAVIKDSDL